MTFLTKQTSTFLLALIILASPINAQEVWISPEIPFLDFEVGEEFYLIERGQDNADFIEKIFPPRETRPCPPFCLQPISLAKDVTTVGEVELIEFIEDFVVTGEGHLIDARVESWHKSGTIPGSINIPFNLFDADENPFVGPVLGLMGGTRTSNGSWSFADAKRLLLYCNGPDCGQSPRAIRNLLALGYPRDRLYYYRGGMKTWARFGFTIVVPE